MNYLLLSLLLNVSVQDKLEGAEIGDTVKALTFATDGTYSAENKEKTGKTLAKGTWSVNGTALDVTVTSCKGPSCKAFGASYHADVALVADRAMTVKATPGDGPLTSGSYYCHYQGCEKRTGVEVSTHGASAAAVRGVVDFLIDKNVGHNTTVVWWGAKQQTGQNVTRVSYCRRDEAAAKASATAVAQDLSGLPWLGTVQVEAGPTDCLYDVSVQVGDTAQAPAK